jgi:phenylacetate-CoA ligase
MGGSRDFYDKRDTLDPAEREAELFRRLPEIVEAAMRAPGYAERLQGVEPAAVTSREALADLPVLRKSELPALQREGLPFGGLVPGRPGTFGRLYTSPGPIFEAEPPTADPWRMARGLHAAGFRESQIAVNTFSYHLTPGGFIFDTGLRALGCAVIPAGPGNVEQQVELLEAYRPSGYCGVPDFLKTLLDACAQKGIEPPFERALVSGAAFPKTLQEAVRAAGVEAFQAYATADLGLVAYETSAREGMVVGEDLILEIVRPGTAEPLPEGEVGEVVVTSLDARRPWLRLALGDLSMELQGQSPCGRTGRRIAGWMGRADQATKVKGMFVRPEQVAEIVRRHELSGRARLVVEREAEADRMTLKLESDTAGPELAAALGETLRAVTKLGGTVELVAPGALPNDGKVIEDRREIG